MTDGDRATARERQRRETRERVFRAAVAEFKRAGRGDADIGRIVSDAGVARGTFYFHFPTKEHVVLELERREEVRIARELTAFLGRDHDLRSALGEVVRLVLKVERRLGSTLFKEMLSLHFSPARPGGAERVAAGDTDDEWTDHPVIVCVVGEFEDARRRGEAYGDVDAFHSAVFFLLGLYALLTTTTESKSVRASILDKFVGTALRSIEPR